jgi:hypothetical protein
LGLPKWFSGVSHERTTAQELISAVIVHAPSNSEKLEVELKGRLEEGVI